VAQHLAERTRSAFAELLAEFDDDPTERRRGLDRQTSGHDHPSRRSHPTQQRPQVGAAATTTTAAAAAQCAPLESSVNPSDHLAAPVQLKKCIGLLM
jgi:hypothetical protein